MASEQAGRKRSLEQMAATDATEDQSAARLQSSPQRSPNLAWRSMAAALPDSRLSATNLAFGPGFVNAADLPPHFMRTDSTDRSKRGGSLWPRGEREGDCHLLSTLFITSS